MIGRAIICRCHDEENQGFRIPGGLSEWELAPVINQSIVKVCNQADLIARCLEDTLYSRIQQINIFNEFLARSCGSPLAAVEVHCNNHPDPGNTGFFAAAHWRSYHARELAACILRRMREAFPSRRDQQMNLVSYRKRWICHRKEYRTRGIKPLAFLIQTRPPAVIIEPANLSNVYDAEWISDAENRAAVGEAVGRGIVDYFKEV